MRYSINDVKNRFSFIDLEFYPNVATQAIAKYYGNHAIPTTITTTTQVRGQHLPFVLPRMTCPRALDQSFSSTSTYSCTKDEIHKSVAREMYDYCKARLGIERVRLSIVCGESCRIVVAYIRASPPRRSILSLN